ncbi:MAG: pimeloyl-ACP methyl ester carboxylesterase [Arcticibacterium sp.]|jgi:pimeloyl-ACP methyl ester carboxylesterase
MKTTFRVIFYFFVGFYISGCSQEDVAVENQYLKSDVLVSTLEKEAFKRQILGAFGDNSSQVLLFVQSGIEQHRITYETKDVNGNTILASGAVIIPTDFPNSRLAIGGLHHGTLNDEADAPSYFKLNTETSLGSFLASTGIVIGMPDYVGYGESKNLPHPYEHNRGLAEPNADFLLAVTELLEDSEIDWNGTLMLGGYSEGGYAAMATHKWIQENLSNKLRVKIAVLGAGSYNKTATFKKILNESSSGSVGNNSSYLWVLETYREIYSLDKPSSYFFKEPYASLIEKNGYNTEIDVSFDTIITDQFKTDFNTNGYPELTAAVADNDIFDWKPNASIKLYHGDNDTFVPFLNSQTTFDAMKRYGTSDIELISIDGGDHGTSIQTYFLGLLQQFTINKGGD